MPTPIKGEHVEIHGEETTVIKGEGARALRAALIHKPALTFAEMAHSKAFVRPEEIDIDDSGNVVIKNKQFLQAMRDQMESDKRTDSFFDTNCQCNPGN